MIFQKNINNHKYVMNIISKNKSIYNFDDLNIKRNVKYYRERERERK